MWSIYYTYLYFENDFKKYQWSSFIATGLMVLTLKELLLVPIGYVLLVMIVKKFNFKIRDSIWLACLGYLIPIILALVIPGVILVESETSEIIFEKPLLFQVKEWVLLWLSYSEHKYYFINVLNNFFPVFAVIFGVFAFSVLVNKRKEVAVFIVPLMVFVLMNVI